MATKTFFLIGPQPSMTPPEFAAFVQQNYIIKYTDGCSSFDLYVDPVMGRVGVEGTIEGPHATIDATFN